MNRKKLIALCECAIMIALAVILDYLSKIVFSFFDPWVNGGGINIAMLPIIYISYRHGLIKGASTAFAYSLLQLITGWYAPPAGGFISFVLCILLDYVVAYTVIGTAVFFAKLIKSRLVGYGFGAFAVIMLRFVCSFLSGAILWGEYITWGFENVWAYSFVYNISFMLPNALLTAGLTVAVCCVFDPLTLKRYHKATDKTENTDI